LRAGREQAERAWRLPAAEITNRQQTAAIFKKRCVPIGAEAPPRTPAPGEKRTRGLSPHLARHCRHLQRERRPGESIAGREATMVGSRCPPSHFDFSMVIPSAWRWKKPSKQIPTGELLAWRGSGVASPQWSWSGRARLSAPGPLSLRPTNVCFGWKADISLSASFPRKRVSRCRTAPIVANRLPQSGLFRSQRNLARFPLSRE